MVQLPERVSLTPIINLRRTLNVSPNFEFKYHKTTIAQKERFFKEILEIPFRVRTAVLDKSTIGFMFDALSPQQLTIELLVSLTMRASELDISNDVLIIDGATPSFSRSLRVQFSERCKREERVRPFKNIIGADSKNEDGLQLADMIAGAVRLQAMETSIDHFQMISPRIVDYWKIP